MALDQHLLDMAEIWFHNAFGNRSAVQKQKCERIGWFYLMRAVMTEMKP